MKRFTKEEFVSAARSIHGDKYDYSKVEYKNNATKVCIVCPIHGEFWQAPVNHLNQKQGCSKCFHESVKKPVYGHGINDTEYVFETKDYKIWRNMLERCYCEKTQKKYPTYIGCYVCDDWLLFSNFKKWFSENYIEGFELDKDIILINNKIYSPDTCCFVPREINSLLRKSVVNKNSGIYKTKSGKYQALISVDKKRRNLGTFNTFNEAKEARDKVFYEKLKNVVGKYEYVLPKHVVESCLKYYDAIKIEK